MTQGFYPNELSSDFLVEVGRGNYQGLSTSGFVVRNPDVGTAAFEDLWGGTGNMVYPTANESWELVSTSANDSSAGTGARLVLVNYLDQDYIQRQTVVATNGLTPVPVSSDCFRPNGATVISSGSLQYNDGQIDIRQVGTNLQRQVILPTIAASQDTHITVPAGKRYFLLLVQPFFTKGDDGVLGGRIKIFGTNTKVQTGRLPFFQNSFSIFFQAKFGLPEKTDLLFEAISNTGSSDVNMVIEYLSEDVY